MNELDSGDDGDNRLDENDPHRLLNIKLDIAPFPTAAPVEPSGNGNSKSATTASKKSSKKKAKETKKVRRS